MRGGRQKSGQEGNVKTIARAIFSDGDNESMASDDNVARLACMCIKSCS